MIQVKLTEIQGQAGCDLSQAGDLVASANDKGLRVVRLVSVRKETLRR